MTSIKISLTNPQRPELGEQEVELIVDTGSVLPWIPKRVLNKLDLRPRRKRVFRTIDGKELERDVGMVTIKYDEHEADVEVVFAEEKDTPVLGVVALESLGYRVNPITGKLEYVGLLAV